MILYDTSILSDIIYDAKTFSAQTLGTEKDVKMNKHINAAMPINNDRKAGVDTEVEMLVSEVKEIFSQVQNLNLSAQVAKNVESNHIERYKMNIPEMEIIGSEAQEILAMLDKVNLLDAETTVQSDVLVSASSSLPQDEVISSNQDSGFKYIHYVFELPIATL
ncbi:hypothetical protein ABT230_002282 [Providencia rettgeri]